MSISMFNIVFAHKNTRTISQYTKYIMLSITLRLILNILFLAIWMIVQSNAQYIRGLQITLPTPIPCNPGTTGSNCTCPANCLFYNSESNGCHPMDCWKYSDVLKTCNSAGKEFLPALILQITLGAFGSGFGNIGRWDIFGIFMGVFFGGCLFICFCGCLCSALNKEEDKESATHAGTKCGSCLWSLAVLIIWIWGIVIIANKDVLGSWTNYKGEPILCPLI